MLRLLIFLKFYVFLFFFFYILYSIFTLYCYSFGCLCSQLTCCKLVSSVYLPKFPRLIHWSVINKSDKTNKKKLLGICIKIYQNNNQKCKIITEICYLINLLTKMFSWKIPMLSAFMLVGLLIIIMKANNEYSFL